MCWCRAVCVKQLHIFNLGSKYILLHKLLQDIRQLHKPYHQEPHLTITLYSSTNLITV